MSSSKGIFHILVADDDPVTARTLRQMIQKMGNFVEVCTDGKSALEVARREGFSILFLDYDMPEMTGVEVVRELRLGGKMVPVVILSAHDREMIAPQLEGLALVKLLTKPASRDEIQTAIKQMAGSIRS